MSDKIRTLKEDASRLLAKNKLAEAADCYEKIVKLDGRDLTARQKLAELYGRLGKTDRAVHLYQSVAGSYAADGLLLKAIAVCKIILQLDPSHTETQRILAELSTKRRGSEEPAKVKMSGAMAEALATTKRSASAVRGAAPTQIRGVPAAQVRPALSPEQVMAEAAAAAKSAPMPPAAVAVAAPSPASTLPPPPPRDPTRPPPPPQASPVGAQVQSHPDDLRRAAAAMLPEAPLPLVAGTPVVEAPTRAVPLPGQQAIPLPSAEDLPIDVDIDDAEPIVVRSAEIADEVALPGRKTFGAPILTAAINAVLPSLDELMDMTPGESPLQAASGDGAAFAEHHADDHSAAPYTGPSAEDVGAYDDSIGGGVDQVEFATDDGANVIDLEPAQIDTAKIPPIPLFSDLPQDAFVTLTEKMDLRVCSVDEPLIVEGEGGDSMFVIIQGEVKVSRKNDEGGQTTLAELGDGTFFGEMALLSDAPRTASVICTEETMLFVISRELVAQITAQYPSVGEVMRKFHKNRLITNLLKTSPIFAPFSTSDKKMLIEKFKSRSVADGTYLITREKPGDGLYVVLSGRCEVLDKNGAQEVVIAELKEGDVFGEMSMLWNKETCASVKATTTCTVLRLPRQQFGEVIMTHPQILETLSALSEKRLAQNKELKSAGIASEFLV